MLGSVLVTPVFMESVGTVNTSNQDVSTEDWTPELIQQTKERIEEGLQWWVDTLAEQTDRHELQFQLDYTYADDPVETLYEPISRISNAFADWTVSFLNAAGVNRTGDVRQDIWDFNHAQRLKHDTNWAFTIFVVNSTNDLDDSFAPGGDFPRAFAFAGGRFIVYPSERPASTVAHETGHMFWALDEYLFSASWERERGYYKTQNLNAVDDNPDPDFVQADSIMASGDSLDAAYANHVSPPSTLAMIGWQDSDGDGIFDVLDVPHRLTGTGHLDPATGMYRFQGHSSVQTLANRNCDGNGNDITINRISRVEYRVDDGDWQEAAAFDDYSVDLDFEIGPFTAGQTIEIRTVDEVTGVTSNVFFGTTDRPSFTTLSGINGGVFHDADGDGQWDNGEDGVAETTVQLVDESGVPLGLQRTLEPDDYTSDFQLINTALPGVTLTAIGSGVADASVLSRVGATSSTGSRVFAHFRSGNQVATEWTPTSRQLKIEFDSPVSTVRIDAVGINGGDVGRLEVFDADDNLLARYTTAELEGDQVEPMVIQRDVAEIAYAVASSHAASAIRLDNLRVGPADSVLTDQFGSFRFGGLPDGSYNVQVVIPEHWRPTSPDPPWQEITFQAGQTIGQIDFGGQETPSPWQNPQNRFDVNGDGTEAPIDVLQIINDLNAHGSRPLPDPPEGDSPPPFLDVSGDRFVAPNDALAVINRLNSAASGGESEGGAAGGAKACGGGSDSTGEGESPWASSGLRRAPRSVSLRDPWKPSTTRTNAPSSPQIAAQRHTAAPRPSLPTARDGFGGDEGWEHMLELLAADVASVAASAGERPGAVAG